MSISIYLILRCSYHLNHSKYFWDMAATWDYGKKPYMNMFQKEVPDKVLIKRFYSSSKRSVNDYCIHQRLSLMSPAFHSERNFVPYPCKQSSFQGQRGEEWGHIISEKGRTSQEDPIGREGAPGSGLSQNRCRGVFFSPAHHTSCCSSREEAWSHLLKCKTGKKFQKCFYQNTSGRKLQRPLCSKVRSATFGPPKAMRPPYLGDLSIMTFLPENKSNNPKWAPEPELTADIAKRCLGFAFSVHLHLLALSPEKSLRSCGASWQQHCPAVLQLTAMSIPKDNKPCAKGAKPSAHSSLDIRQPPPGEGCTDLQQGPPTAVILIPHATNLDVDFPRCSSNIFWL